MFGIEQKVAQTARKAGLVTASAALTCVGAAFLTAAVWMYLSTTQSAMFAALVIGLIYLGIAAILLAVAMARPAPPPHNETPDPMKGLSPMQLILVSFLQGLEQGKNSKRP
jgi:heme/copper-type cytochrome/quinol oxidase subunit 2